MILKYIKDEKLDKDKDLITQLEVAGYKYLSTFKSSVFDGKKENETLVHIVFKL